MALTPCPNGAPFIQELSTYTMSRDEFNSIFGGGNDDIVTNFYHIDGSTERTYTFPPFFCQEDLGEYEDISNLEILGVLIGQPPFALLILTGVYLKIQSNVMRYLQSVEVCKCRNVIVPDEPFPDPLIPPDSPVPPNPDDQCCQTCFQSLRENLNIAITQFQSNIAPYLADGYEVVNLTYQPIPPMEFIAWVDTVCSVDGFICQYYLISFGLQLRKEVPVTPSNPNGFLVFPENGTSIGTNFTFLRRIYCGDNVPTDTPFPVPPPIPLPEDTFSFCEQFPALCNACPDDNSQDVVVSGKIASTCAVKDDISFNVKF